MRPSIGDTIVQNSTFSRADSTSARAAANAPVFSSSLALWVSSSCWLAAPLATNFV